MSSLNDKLQVVKVNLMAARSTGFYDPTMADQDAKTVAEVQEWLEKKATNADAD